MASAVGAVSNLLFALFHYYSIYFSHYTHYFKVQKCDSDQNSLQKRVPSNKLAGTEGAYHHSLSPKINVRGGCWNGWTKLFAQSFNRFGDLGALVARVTEILISLKFFCDLALMEVSELNGIVWFIVRSVCKQFCSCLCACNIRIRCRLIH